MVPAGGSDQNGKGGFSSGGVLIDGGGAFDRSTWTDVQASMSLSVATDAWPTELEAMAVGFRGLIASRTTWRAARSIFGHVR